MRSDFMDIRIIDPALIAQLAILIEDINMRRGQNAKLARDFLTLAIVEIWEFVIAVLGANFHFRQRIAEFGVAQLVEPQSIWIVGRNRHQRHAAVFEIAIELNNPIVVCLGRWTVIAGEHNDEQLRVMKIGQPIGFAVDSRQLKIRRQACRFPAVWDPPPLRFALPRRD